MTHPAKSFEPGRNVSRAALLALWVGVPFAAAQVHPLAPAPVSLDWVAQYNGPFSYWDELHDLALGDGCIYVTGFAYKDYASATYATVKYDYSGRQVWAREYGLDGPNSGASAEALAVDGAGNVLVTGRSADFRSDEEFYVDAAILKYDPDGNLLWEHRYRLPGKNNQPLDLAIDSWGNAYVAGAAWVESGFDLMLLKYAPAGTLLWDRAIGRRGELWDAGYAVTIDPEGNPVVAGYTEPVVHGFQTGYLVKYSSNGRLLWERDHETCTNHSAWWRVAINAQGLIYAFGEIAPCGDLNHVWTSQYDADGTLLWDRHYDGNAGGANYRGGMALTPTGGVVVSGTSDDFNDEGGVQNMVTIRYEADGTEVWRRLERGGYAQAHGRDVAVDAEGNAYVSGYGFDQNENSDYVTLKYTPDGSLAWTQIFAGQAGLTDIPIRIAVDDAQNVFIAGDTHGGLEPYFDYATIRYRQPGLQKAHPRRHP